MSNIALKFDGGLAASGNLYFYEHSRSLYAFARFVATVESYRRTQRVPERIHRGDYEGILVHPPREGSFITELLVQPAREAAAAFATGQFQSLFAYAWQLLLPSESRKEEIAVELAKIRLAEERERTRQSEEETKRMALLSEVSREGQASSKQALELLEWALTSSSTAIPRLGLDQPLIPFAQVVTIFSVRA